MTGLAAIHQADAAHIIDLRAGRIDVDLLQLDIHSRSAVEQALQIRRAKAGQAFFHEGIERDLRFLRGFILIAALGDEHGLLAHDAGKGVVQVVVIEFAKLGAIGGGPIEIVGEGPGRVEILQLGGFGAFGTFRNLLELIGERAHFAAGILKIGSQGGALAIEQIDLFLNLAIGRKGRAPGIIHGGFQLLVIGRSIKGLFGGAALGDLLLKIAAIKSAKAVLVEAPRAQTEKFAIERPGHCQQQQGNRGEQTCNRPFAPAPAPDPFGHTRWPRADWFTG